MPLIYSENQAVTDEERDEIKAILDSGILRKAPNLQRFLEYVAEQYFAGTSDQIKEYHIAVQAFRRPEHFDPQSDTIVRVTAHALRKKLEQYYATEGADHPIQVQLPAGKYVLTFERKHPSPTPLTVPETSIDTHKSSPDSLNLPVEVPQKMTQRWWIISGVAAFSVLLIISIHQTGHNRPATIATTKSTVATPNAALPSISNAGNNVVRMRFGGNQRPFTDSSGQVWMPDQSCSGGSTFAHPNREVQGTDDQIIFQEGREGKFQCRIPVPSGEYQLTVLFADTAGDKVSTRGVDFTINQDRHIGLDVVDEAGGNDIAVGKVYAGIHPMADGAVHLDFTSDGAFANAIELTPSSSPGGAPLRMLAGPSVVRDSAGNVWGPERFFQGGRVAFHADKLPKTAEPRLFSWERYGHFRYVIPVVQDKEYKLSLYFSEAWFGSSNGGAGGVGSRVFDVYCNGHTLLSSFDILRERSDGTAIMTFHRVRPTAHGMLDLDFVPVTNYPLINAIEVEPED
jgi:hypothetical protein